MHCMNCGAELVEGQRFCRACGKPSANLEGAEARPTVETDPNGLQHAPVAHSINTNPVANATHGQTTLMQDSYRPDTTIMNAKPQTGGQGRTPDAAASAPPTSPIIEPPLAAEISIHSTAPFHMEKPRLTQAPQAPVNFQAPPQYAPTASPPPKSYGWLIALGGIALFGFIFFAFLLFGRSQRAAKRPTTTTTTATVTPDQTNDNYMNEATARVTSEETTFTQKFPLPESAKFFLNNVSGNITIVGSDSTEAEVKVIKSGGTAEQRQEVKIVYSTIGGGLSLKPSAHFIQDIDIAYEIRLPRKLSQVNVKAVSSKIKIKDVDALITIECASSNMELENLRGALNAKTDSGDIFVAKTSGDINVKTLSGKIELDEVSGSIKTVNTSGNTKAMIDNSTSNDVLTFESINGAIDLRFKAEINAEMIASTVSGNIKTEGLGIAVKKMPGSQEAIGRLGIGGQALNIKTVSGDIKITKKS
ncbi:MAG: zinc-ribbon domain-containing protein [Acidobacteria bacterium]|nr:zinc-ribbon domain-containing protein [Acidobacteriota bacterium]